ncbi:unnamed protein product [marine sediment metagenome]|uniref:Uncharacterized protein n=1 Tax=marine sediment metagenome TaxID=412755 RepID=X1HX32_9ZZZZ
MRQKVEFLIGNECTIGYLVKENAKTVVIEARVQNWLLRDPQCPFVHNFRTKRHKVKHKVVRL